MAEFTIRFVFNLETGKKDIYIDYQSEEDALPMEHEQEHRELVGQLLGQGALHPDELGTIQLNRVAPAQTASHQEQVTSGEILSTKN